jgi:recombinational DNA repair protein (RecF pathway)
MVFKGERLHRIAAAAFDDPAVLRDAGRLLREVIRHHLDGRELKSRKVLLDLHRVRMAKNDSPERR